jgi:hypothetical protein
MKKDRLSILLIFAISFLLPLSCAYSCFNVIVEADFLTRGVKYEGVDIENLLLDRKSLAGVVPNPFFLSLLPVDNFFEPLSAFSLPIPLVYLTSSILRC